MSTAPVEAAQDTEASFHLHGTLPSEVMNALMPPAEAPDGEFEPWEDGAYVLAFVRTNRLA